MKLKQAEEIQSLMNYLRASKDELEKFNKIKRDGRIYVKEYERSQISFIQDCRYTGTEYKKIHKYIKTVLEEKIKEIEDKINNIK